MRLIIEIIFYLISVVLLCAGFLCFKKSEKKLNIIKWVTIFIVSFMGYNITICMILGLLKITCYLWLLGILNVTVGNALAYKTVKNKDFQKYTISKKDIAGLAILVTIFAIIVVKEIKPQDGGIKYAAVDSAIHYRAAKHFKDNLMLFVNCEDKTIFNFNVMQTGSYINDGLLMKVINGLFGVPEYYIYEVFEISMLFVSGLAFYSLIIDKIKGKLGFVLTMFLIWLFIFAYPYNSYMYGFSYLSVGVIFVITLISVVQMLFDEDKIKLPFVLVLISFLAMGEIFSYCLFAPGVFAAICIYVFIKDFGQEEKVFLKVFKKRTLIITGILFAIAVFGMGYLFVPTFFIANQSNLVEALKNPGGMYSELFRNFEFYAIFGLMYVVNIIKKARKKEYHPEFLDVFSWVFGVYFLVAWIGMRMAVVSDYYFFKMYYVLWVCIVAITVKIINEFCTQKYFKILLPIYEASWVLLVLVTIIFKAGIVLPQDQKDKIPNYVGIYFQENYMLKGLIFAFNNYKSDQIKTSEILSKIEDAKAENVLFITGSNYERAWTLAISNLQTDGKKYDEIIGDATQYYLQNGLDNENIKYIVKIGMTDETEDLDEFLSENPEQNQIEVLHKSQRCYIVKKNT